MAFQTFYDFMSSVEWTLNFTVMLQNATGASFFKCKIKVATISFYWDDLALVRDTVRGIFDLNLAWVRVVRVGLIEFTLMIHAIPSENSAGKKNIVQFID